MKKTILSLLLVLCLMAALLPFGALADTSWSVNWSMTPQGALTVSGSGALPDHYADQDSSSWKSYRGRIVSAVFESGFTALGSGTLANLPVLTTVTIPASVVVLARDLFSGSGAIRNVYYGGTEAAWKAAGGAQTGLPSGARVHFAGAPAPASPFVDVPASAYYAPAVTWAVAKGVTEGTDASHFSPESGCTRAQVVTFLWRAFGNPEPTRAYNPFQDVRSSDYFCKAVLWAVETGVTTGADATHFEPYAICTRAQVVTFLWRAAGKPAASGTTAFVDVAPTQYYAPAVSWAVSRGITTGADATHFDPNGVCTRAQVVTFLWRDLK